jgi:hypothetical protein
MANFRKIVIGGSCLKRSRIPQNQAIAKKTDAQSLCETNISGASVLHSFVSGPDTPSCDIHPPQTGVSS